jgi:hypothetical protein
MIFVIVMTYEQKKADEIPSPEKEPSGSSVGQVLSPDKIGQLVKLKDGVFIEFDQGKFDPLNEQDIEQMIEKGLIMENKETGKKEIRLIDNESGVLISEYFSTFSLFTQRGIQIVFGEVDK